MTHRSRLALQSALAAGALAVLAYVAIGLMSGAGLASWFRNATSALAIAPATAMAAWLAAWWCVGWWRNVDGLRPWTPIGMALRIVVLAFLLFPPLVAAWIACGEAIARLFAAAPAAFGEAMAWVPAIAVYATLFGVLLGFVPALCIEYFLCRRFLRGARVAGAPA